MKYKDLKIIDELREKGSISEEEYQREKEKILKDQYKENTSADKKPLFGLSENSYLMLMHISQIAGGIVPLLGFIIPILMWTTNKDTNANVDLHGKNILNAMISYTLYALILAVTVIGAAIVGVIYLVLLIIAGVKANNGEYWKYPFTIQFIK